MTEPSKAPMTEEALNKRYEGLLTVRTKAVKGKGAWYWSHLEPILVLNPETNTPKSVKLKCCLCSSLFSASNPSRTATEHLKRGTCPNYSVSGVPGPQSPKPISSVHPLSMPGLSSPSGYGPGSARKRRKRVRPVAVEGVVTTVGDVRDSGSGVVASISCLPTPDDVYFATHHHEPPPQQMLSGGKEDLGALAMLEDSVKKLKSPSKSTPSLTLTKAQANSALTSLADWIYESGGSVPFSLLEHPRFTTFLNHVGLPAVASQDLMEPRLDVRYDKARYESEARIKDAMFFQVSSEGWKPKGLGEENLASLSVNLPNGTSVFRRAVFTSGAVPSLYAEEVLGDTIRDICGNSVQQCVSIVSDKFKSKALRNLEGQFPWMVNLSCQFQGFVSLIKDFNRELPLFKNMIENCVKLANFVNSKPQVWNSFRKYQVQEYGQSGFLRVPSKPYEKSNIDKLFTLVDDILTSARALQLVLMDESYKIVPVEEQMGRDIEDMMRNPHFWSELESVHSLIKLVKSMAHEIEKERPLVGQCIPLWDELRSKVKDWCVTFNINETLVEKIIDRRFRKNYHPSWSAAFVLDPIYLMGDNMGKYMPPFKCLTPEQEKDVDKLITRLVSREEAHIALMELMKWRTEGLEPVYAQAVQLKQRDPITGKLKLANPQSSRLVWETHLTQYKSLGKVAVRLIFLHATSCGFKFNWSFLRGVNCSYVNSKDGTERAQKLIFIAAHSKLERRESSSNEDREAEFFMLANGENDVLNEVFC